VAYWTDGRQAKILTVTPGYELVALDAKTGQPDVGFGNRGIVDLTEQVEKDSNFNPSIGHLMNTSPPLVFGNVAIIPTSLENARIAKSMKFPKAT
jgi:quinoprotein glucose dehydrogenase